MYYLNDFCCICLNNDDHLITLSEKDEDGLTYFQKLTDCVPEMNSEEIDPDKYICMGCIDGLDEVYYFRVMCIENKFVFLDYLTKLTSVGNTNGLLDVKVIDIHGKGKKKQKKQTKTKDNVARSYHHKKIKLSLDDGVGGQPKKRNSKPTTSQNTKTNIKLKIVNNSKVYNSSDMIGKELIGNNIDTCGNNIEMIENTAETITTQSEAIGSISRTVDNHPETIRNRPETIGNCPETIGMNSEIIGSSSETTEGNSEAFRSNSETTGSNLETIVNCESIPSNSEILESSIGTVESNSVTIESNSLTDESNPLVNGSSFNTVGSDDSIGVESEMTDSNSTKIRCGPKSKTSMSRIGCSPRKIGNNSETVGSYDESKNTFVNHVKNNNNSLHSEVKIKQDLDISDSQLEIKQEDLDIDDQNDIKQEMTEDESKENNVNNSVYNEIVPDKIGAKLMQMTLNDDEMFLSRQNDFEDNHMSTSSCSNNSLESKPFHSKMDQDCLKPKNVTTTIKRISSTKEIMCKFCEQTFDDRKSLETHVCTDNLTAQTDCKYCYKHFKTHNELCDHLCDGYEQNNLFRCEVCDVIFPTQLTLVNHQNVRHGTIKYQCRICEKGFGHLMQLRDHLSNEHRVKPHMCDICCKSYVHPRDLKTHINRHKGWKPFNCRLCSKDFFSKSELRRHMKSHN